MSEQRSEVEVGPIKVAERVMVKQEEGLIGAVREFLPSFPALTVVEGALGGVIATFGATIDALQAINLPPDLIDQFGKVGIQALSKMNFIQQGALAAGLVTFGLGILMVGHAAYENHRYIRGLQIENSELKVVNRISEDIHPNQ